MDELFFPKGVCIIGASRDPQALGHIILKNILSGGFSGHVYPINPKCEILLGLRCYSSVRDLPTVPDLAILAVPANAVPSVIAECGEKGIPYAVIITAGFKETGEKGAELEREVLRIAREKGVRIVGPNCMGLYNSFNSLTATFTLMVPKKGNISFISQSGAVGTTMLAWAKKAGIGFSKFISIGNESDISLPELLLYLSDDKTTKVITAYMESVKDGRAFLEALRKVSSNKPTIILKVGSTPAGAKAAASHTGAIAVESSVLEGIFRQFSVIQARDTEELFQLAHAFSSLPLPQGSSAAVVSSGGGWAIECADALESSKIRLTPLPESVIKELDGLLPPYWSRRNPLDMVASINSEAYYQAIKLLMESEYDLVFLIGYGVLGSIAIPMAADRDVEYAKKISELVNVYKKPIFVVDVLGEDLSECARTFKQHNLPVFRTVKSAVRVASEMVHYSVRLKSRSKN
ncbi:MAG: CoA-binding protein [Candidatus Methanomethyliaceae archaeon]|nr:CoA-binding protein [Candidatus Methanomethyliaceae archaeon]